MYTPSAESFVVGIVLLAMVAGFLALRLYAVLGKRTGHEQPIAPVEDRPAASAPVPIGDARPPAVNQPATVFEASAATGIRSIVAAEPQFDVARFVDGAKAAYRLILEAYWRGDEAALRDLTSDDVRSAFAQSIADRREAGHVLDNRLVNIERASISEASLSGRSARVTVRFDADIAAVTRDSDGTVIAGSMTDAVPTHDVWTFERTVRSDDPNWTLVDTDESA